MSAPRPCSYCGNGQFIWAPGLMLEFLQMTKLMGMPSIQGTDYTGLGLLACTGCRRVELFVEDLQKFSKLPNASVLQATGGGANTE